MDAKVPEVSVVIPVYNHPEWLDEAIQSVLNQSYQDFEIIVVDDGSTDDISNLPILSNEKIRYFRNENHGVAYSRNFGIKKAEGSYVAFLDSDDIWFKDKLKIQILEMKRKNAEWSQHCFEIFNDASKKVESKVNTFAYKGKEKRCLFLSFKVQTSCFIVKKKAIIDNNIMFDESKTFGEEATFYRELAKLYPLLFIDKYLVKYRNHGDNVGKNASVQLTSRADCWREQKEDVFFKNNTTFCVKTAYAYCGLLEDILRKIKFRNYIVISVLYLPAWLIFKAETFRLCRKRVLN